MPAPDELKLMTLRELRATRKFMLSGPWEVFLQKQTPEKQAEAARKANDIELAILALQQAALADIRNKLVANEKDLVKGTQALAEARANLATLQTVLEAVGTVLSIVAKIAKFAATGI
jgi:hypothetical protein